MLTDKEMAQEAIKDDANTRRNINKNISWLFSGQTIGRTLRTLLLIYAARELGVAGWGALSYALSVVTFFTIFADVGINAYVTRGISQTPEKKQTYISTVFYIKLFILSLIVLASVFLSQFITNIEEVAALMPIVAIIVIFDALRDFGAAIARATEKMRIEGLNHIITNAIIAGAGTFILLTSPTSANLMWAYVAGTGVGLISILFALRGHLSGILTKFNPSLIKTILYSSWPFGIIGLMGIIIINTDIIMIGWLTSVDEVGLYSAGQKIVQLLYLVPTLISIAFFPVLARSINLKEKFKALFEQALSIIFMIAIPLSIGGVILSAQIIDILFGAQYAGAVPSFAVLMLTTVMVFPAVLIANAIFAYDKQKAFLIYVLAGIVGNIVLNLLLIPVWGILGSAIATLLNQSIINIYLWTKMKRISNFKILYKLNKIIFSAGLMGVVSMFMNSFGVNVLVTVAVSGATYFGMLYIMKDESLCSLLEIKHLEKTEQ